MWMGRLDFCLTGTFSTAKKIYPSRTAIIVDYHAHCPTFPGRRLALGCFTSGGKGSSRYESHRRHEHAGADLSRDTDLGTVGGMMREHDLGFIPVVSAARKVVGLVTDRDICMVAASRRRAPVHLSAAQAMSETVHACFPDDAVDFVLASMRQFKVRRLPVVDSSGVISGVISLNDIVRAAGTRPDVSVNEVISTLADICEPRRLVTTP